VSQAEARKVIKYANFSHTYMFTPVAIETLGVWGPGETELAASIGRRIMETTEDTRLPYDFRQRIDLAVQRGNALSILGHLKHQSYVRMSCNFANSLDPS